MSRYIFFVVLVLCGITVSGCSKSETQKVTQARGIAQWEKMMQDMNMRGPHFTQIVGMSAYVPVEIENLHLALKLDGPRARYQLTEEETQLCEDNIRKIFASSKQVKISIYDNKTYRRDFTITDTDIFQDISNHFAFSDEPVLYFPVSWDRGADLSILTFEPSGLTLTRKGQPNEEKSPPDLFVVLRGKSFQEVECSLTVESIEAFKALVPSF